jgi:AcrR family transcriptional regulator
VAHVSASDRRPQLVRAAIDVMRREGVASASTRAIAAELGIAQAMVHYVFGTKDELYAGVIQQVTAEVTAKIRERQPLPHSSSFRDVVESIAQGFWQAVLEDQGAFALLSEMVLYGWRSPSLAPAIADYQRQLDEAFADKFRDAYARTGIAPARPPEDVAHFFFAGVDGLLVHRLALQRDHESYLRCLQDIVDATTALATGEPVPARGNDGAARLLTID